MSAPTTDAPLTELAKHDPVQDGDLLARQDGHLLARQDGDRRWRTYRVWKVIQHRNRNQFGPNHTHAERTIHLIRDIDAVPEQGSGTAYTHWGRDAGYHRITHTQGYHLVDRSDDGRSWVAAQQAIEAQDDIDQAARAEIERRSPAALADRLVGQARELERQAREAQALSQSLLQSAAGLRAEADLIATGQAVPQ